ncbi:TPA: hypothetical protein ACH3X1_013044 [Trebouxia sp. C0004]
MQGHESKLADAGRYLILLARTIKALGTAEPGLIPQDFTAHAYSVFNRQWLQMATPLFMLALFLHPGYRVLGRNADGRDDFKVIGREAVEMLRARKRSQNEITIMLSDFMDYKNAIPPFDAPMQQTDTIETWWKRVAASQPPDCPKGIVLVACLVACFIAHAADPERAFSFMGNVHSRLRIRFKATTVGAVAETKSYLQLCPPENLAMYQPKQLRPTAAKATKKQCTLDEADAQPLDITETARYQAMNPVRPAAPVAEVIDVAAQVDEFEVSDDDDAESPEELLDFFSAALGHEQQYAMNVRQDRLDVELQFDIEAALWDGEYVSVSPLEEVPAFGDATDSQNMDVDAALNDVCG